MSSSYRPTETRINPIIVEPRLSDDSDVEKNSNAASQGKPPVRTVTGASGVAVKKPK